MCTKPSTYRSMFSSWREERVEERQWRHAPRCCPALRRRSLLLHNDTPPVIDSVVRGPVPRHPRVPPRPAARSPAPPSSVFSIGRPASLHGPAPPSSAVPPRLPPCCPARPPLPLSRSRSAPGFKTALRSAVLLSPYDLSRSARPPPFRPET